MASSAWRNSPREDLPMQWFGPSALLLTQTNAPPQAPVLAGAPGTPSASDVYDALRAQRRELGRQISSLEDQRRSISSRLQQVPSVNGADRTGLEQRITQIDARIAAIDKEIASTDAAVAKAAGIPGAVVEPPPMRRPGPPEEVYVLTGI